MFSHRAGETEEEQEMLDKTKMETQRRKSKVKCFCTAVLKLDP